MASFSCHVVGVTSRFGLNELLGRTGLQTECYTHATHKPLPLASI